MSGALPPIDIATPSRSRLSASPRNQASNLTSALQQAGATSSHTPGGTARQNHDVLRPPFGRQDSLGFALGSSVSGARPISNAGKGRRESIVGGNSFMGGMSWGGISVGSWVQDDIMMGGTSPYNFQSPSFHSSSYLPKMEANFWNNLKCCDTTFNDLHELLSHFEEIHSQAPSTFPYRMSASGSDRPPRRKSSGIGGFSSNQGERPLNQVRGFQPVSDSKLNGMQSSQLQTEGLNKNALANMHDMDTFGDMEMDHSDAQIFDQDLPTFDEEADSFSSPQLGSRPVPLQMNSTSTVHSQDFSGSNPTTPRPAFQGFQPQNNPMVSSVNTPAFGTQQERLNSESTTFGQQNYSVDADPTLTGAQYSSNTMPFNSRMLQRLQADFSGLDVNGNGTSNGGEMLDLCIAEPAKALYSENGGFNSQQFPHFNFTQSTIVSNGDENARKLQAHRLASGIGKMPGEEERPFKCPVIGCEKAYKNANGLRYHEKHGHSTQKLKDNGDGTFSIVDPLTSIPYPGTIGMEKEKPYRCEVCGKRYKNLNGLKYHRNHSPPCNPEFSLNGGMPGPAGVGEGLVAGEDGAF